MKFVVFLFCLVWSAVVRGGPPLHSVSGEVSRGQFTYYTLMFEGPITLTLYSDTGDADLYISQYVAKPTYELDSHCLQSVTCGVDTVHIPASYKRPIGIGVYGHTSHDISSYHLEASYTDEENIEIDLFARDNSSFEDTEEVQREESEGHLEGGRSHYSSLKHTKDIDGVDIDEGESEEGEVSALRALILPVISILLEVLVL